MNYESWIVEDIVRDEVPTSVAVFAKKCIKINIEVYQCHHQGVRANFYAKEISFAWMKLNKLGQIQRPYTKLPFNRLRNPHVLYLLRRGSGYCVHIQVICRKTPRLSTTICGSQKVSLMRGSNSRHAALIGLGVAISTTRLPVQSRRVKAHRNLVKQLT